jgi:hypothetical protein
MYTAPLCVAPQGVVWSAQEGAIVYSLKDGSGAYFCLQNNSPDGVQITLDLRGSENVVMSRGTEETLDVVPPYKAMLLNTATGMRFFFRPLCFGTCVRMPTCPHVHMSTCHMSCTHVMYTCHVHMSTLFSESFLPLVCLECLRCL